MNTIKIDVREMLKAGKIIEKHYTTSPDFVRKDDEGWVRLR